MNNYHFESAFPAGHFVADYIAYASTLCDAAHDYHEACALVLLATATPDVFAKLKQFPDGLRTNLYAALVGSTSISRKSTAKDIAVDVWKRAFSLVLLPDKSTPEAFVDDLSTRTRQPALWVVDEYAAMLKQIKRRDYLSGLESLLLELYQRPNHTYKRMKGTLEVKDSHLTILGCAADTVFDALHKDDVESGLLPRHAIIFPQSKPDYMPFAASSTQDDLARNDLVKRLIAVAPPNRDSEGRWIDPPRLVRFTDDAFTAVDTFAQAHQGRYTGELQARIVPMLLKIGMLAAIGGFSLNHGPDIVVEAEDIERASVVMLRWSKCADDFTIRLGENQQEKLIRRAVTYLEKRNVERIFRRVVFRHLHIDMRTFDGIEATMEGRGTIELERDSEKAKKPNVWKWLDFGKTKGD